MLVEEKKFQEEDGSIGYYEAVYDSSNILKTTYFPKQNKLYISFNRGGVYSYENVGFDLYEEFKNEESQGKFFAKMLKSNPNKHPYHKEFTLYPDEVKELKEVVEKHQDNIKDVKEFKEEDEGIVEVLKRVLGFYADKMNYEPESDMIDKDMGEQARQVLGLVDKLQKESEKMEQDYEKIMMEELKNAGDPDKMKNIINSIKKSVKDGD
jgi:hypothetical protein